MIDTLLKIKSELELKKRFGTELSCQQALLTWKWPNGFECCCGGRSAAFLASRRIWYCQTCGRQTSLMAGTVFSHSKSPLPKWFRALWVFLHEGRNSLERSPGKRPEGPMSIQRFMDRLGLKRYQTAWTWMQKLRALVSELELETSLGPKFRQAIQRVMKAKGARGCRAWGQVRRGGHRNWQQRQVTELRRALGGARQHLAQRRVLAWLESLGPIPTSRKHFGRWLAEGLLRCWQCFGLDLPSTPWSSLALPYWRLVFRSQPSVRLQASWEG